MEYFTNNLPLVLQSELSLRYELTGGFIKNAILSALSIAVSRDGDNPLITQADLLKGASLQLRGRLRMKVCVCVYARVCLSVYVYVCARTYTCLCVYTYTCTFMCGLISRISIVVSSPLVAWMRLL